MKLISGIKQAVAEMRVEAEGATCYREKCCIILSTAIGASVALDQASPSPLQCFFKRFVSLFLRYHKSFHGYSGSIWSVSDLYFCQNASSLAFCPSPEEDRPSPAHLDASLYDNDACFCQALQPFVHMRRLCTRAIWGRRMSRSCACSALRLHQPWRWGRPGSGCACHASASSHELVHPPMP